MSPAELAPREQHRRGVLYDVDAHGERLVVKHTFLNLVEDTAEDDKLQLRRSRTDSALCGLGRHWDVEYRPGTPSSSAASSASTRVVSDHEDSDGPGGDGAQSAPYFANHGAAAGVAQPPLPAGACRPSAAASAAGSAEARKVAAAHGEKADGRTTLMLRNLPNSYTRDMLLAMLDEEGFAGAYDFVYLPIDFARGCGLGYAFVNLVDHSFVPAFRARLDGFSRWKIRTSKVCQVTYSDRDQGLRANVRRYRNSPVMHESVDDAWKPCLFADGERIPFPAPRGRLVRPSGRRG